ncbi:Ribonuclease H domain [Arabidopsis thaliana x Arabidopsis arenosa]|uniref:Ribonuclease H domain n=1 Tax=Arabidopsis thaliana x Arabidopsis arenosa TaxID=1240361 RepID=A0A8T2AV38_9BRAS|nr:Ribonuclease H domain [Arabidopsis thaliana x Arabidopsis arenosa]
MFFCKTSESSCLALKRILGLYEAASGQKINTSKSSISFARKTPAGQRQRVKQLLGVEKDGGVGKYLGLPEHFGRKKKDLFSSIVDRVRQKALSWSNKFLSSAGKMTLLKSVLSAMPSYAMSCFQLPVSLCKRIQSALTRFWWDSKADKKGMCWVAWEKLTKSKHDGGLGLRDLQNFNSALLGKLGWRILKHPNCLLARVLLGKYCSSTPFVKALCPANASHGWRSILVGRDLLHQKLGWALGDGCSINIWSDPWLSVSQPCQPMGPAPLWSKDWRVKDLFVQDSVEWDVQKIQAIFPNSVSEILSLKPSRLGAADRLVWLGNSTGEYTTKSGYYVAIAGSVISTPNSHTSGVNWKAEVWSIHTAPKVKMFLWKALHGALATGQQLAERCIAANISCGRCGEQESILHVLFSCPFAQKVWKLAPVVLPPISFYSPASVREGLKAAMGLVCLPPTGLGSAQTKKQPPILISSPAPSRKNVSPLDFSGIACRSDGAWRKDLQAAGLGWTFSGPPGIPPHHSALCENVSSPLMAESLACRAAIMDAIDSGATHLLLESDCLQLVGAINAQSIILEIHGIISDIFLCVKSLSSFICRYIPRSANVVADTLAKYCLSLYGQNI